MEKQEEYLRMTETPYFAELLEIRQKQNVDYTYEN